MVAMEFTTVIERFRSRISFRDELRSSTTFKRHVKNFLRLREKARELGGNSFESKLFHLMRLTGANYCENYASCTQEQ